MKVSWGYEIPNIWKSKKCSKPPTRCRLKKKKTGYQLSKLWVIGLGLSLCSLSGAKILANLGLLDILIKGWQKRKTSPNFLE